MISIESGIELGYPAWLETAVGVVNCTIVRISGSDANLSVPEGAELASEFDLWLTRNGACRRRCRIAEKDGTRVAVRFLDMPLSSIRRFCSQTNASSQFGTL